ncbi:hypothetical protein QMK19_14685 [Streptomyces sp. H10-C2]|uniref:hypothetical protein n=1 Tax=unclassified Streptomyces TaxID=2593676 RepID=UPI0024BABAC4|nr:MULTISPECIES: hypothetical protein [unclassified Streptomyces]MDJ0341302.1 hypothetical protein [Streptomyces sp. PH10-H1]MDJ0370897.1 hypothetical protein [Streptomyces sp. H10-C2]
MDARDPELKKELAATLQARKDLGAEYESELVDSFMEKVDQRLDSHVEQRVRRQLAEQQTSFARAGRGPGQPEPNARFARYGFAGFTMIAAIPLSAIGAVNAGGGGLLITWAGIVGVNVAQSLGLILAGDRAERRRKSDSDWE